MIALPSVPRSHEFVRRGIAQGARRLLMPARCLGADAGVAPSIDEREVSASRRGRAIDRRPIVRRVRVLRRFVERQRTNVKGETRSEDREEDRARLAVSNVRGKSCDARSERLPGLDCRQRGLERRRSDASHRAT
jgi:hypothetical protein